MATQDYVKRENFGIGVQKIPFIICMVDAAGNLRDMPFPNQETAQTIERILGIELMINPASLSLNMAKVINRTQSMVSFIEEHWGEELDTISIQGSSAAFITGGSDLYSIRLNATGNSPTKRFLETNGGTDFGVVERSGLYSTVGALPSSSEGQGVTDNEIGLTTSRRRWSISYRMFKRMMDLVRINGCFYDSRGFV